MFSNGDFLFAYLEDEDFAKRGLLLKERICSDGSKFFLSELTPNETGDKNENERVVSPRKEYPFTLRPITYTALPHNIFQYYSNGSKRKSQRWTKETADK